MHPSTLLLALAATVSASEVAIPGHQVVKRALEARQTSGSGSSGCITSIMSLYTNIPTPPAQINSFLATASVKDPCSLSVPATLTAAYSSYLGAVNSWASANSAKLNSAISACPAASSLAAQATGSTCSGSGSSSGNSGGTGSSGNSGSNSGSNNGGDSGSGSNPPAAKGGAKANVVASGMAAVGFLGAVVLL